MPFPQQMLRPLTHEQIDALPPGRYGVYGLLSEAGEYIYIGSGVIRTHLLALVDGAVPRISERAPTDWVEWVLPARATTSIAILPHLEDRQRELVEEYSPACNVAAE